MVSLGRRAEDHSSTEAVVVTAAGRPARKPNASTWKEYKGFVCPRIPEHLVRVRWDLELVHRMCTGPAGGALQCWHAGRRVLDGYEAVVEAAKAYASACRPPLSCFQKCGYEIEFFCAAIAGGSSERPDMLKARLRRAAECEAEFSLKLADYQSEFSSWDPHLLSRREAEMGEDPRRLPIRNDYERTLSGKCSDPKNQVRRSGARVAPSPGTAPKETTSPTGHLGLALSLFDDQSAASALSVMGAAALPPRVQDLRKLQEEAAKEVAGDWKVPLELVRRCCLPPGSTGEELPYYSREQILEMVENQHSFWILEEAT